MPIEEKEAVAPDFIRSRIISVVAENWGRYLGGESFMGASLLPGAVGVCGGPLDAILVEVEA